MGYICTTFLSELITVENGNDKRIKSNRYGKSVSFFLIRYVNNVTPDFSFSYPTFKTTDNIHICIHLENYCRVRVDYENRRIVYYLKAFLFADHFHSTNTRLRNFRNETHFQRN